MPELHAKFIVWKNRITAKLIQEDRFVLMPILSTPQVIDNNRVSWAAHKPASGSHCINCTYYVVAVEEEPSLKDGDDNPLHTAPPQVNGSCIYLMPEYLITNVKVTQGCELHEKRPDEFVDDAIEDKLKVW